MVVVTLPNSLSLSRVVLALALCWAILRGAGAVSVVLFGCAVVTDLLDGFVARRRRQESALGALLDHAADAIFVASVGAVCAAIGLVPALLPVVICAAFIQYVGDSFSASKNTLRASRLGRWNGIAYFIVVGASIVVNFYATSSSAAWLLYTCAWVLVGATLLSMLDRAWHQLKRSR